jgi:hypothetical protein
LHISQQTEKRSLQADILRTCCLRQFGEFLQLTENEQDYHTREIAFDVGHICPKGTGIEPISGLTKLRADAPKVLRRLAFLLDQL